MLDTRSVARARHRWVQTALVAIAVPGLVGFGHGASAFGKRDLPNLIFAKREAPAGTKLNPTNVGVGFLEREGGNGDFFTLLRPHGFVADSGSEFYGSAKGVAYAESLAFLFKSAKGASDALAALRVAIGQLGSGVKGVGRPHLGSESWGVRGTFAPKSPPGYFYMWRVENVILAFTMSGPPAVVTERTARSYAAKLGAHARRP
jgi:hypothetical protein